MPDYDAGFKIVARAAGRQLAELAGVHCEQWEPIGGEVQATERLADRAFRAQTGAESFVVYMEAYTRWQASAPWSVLSKSSLLSERERLPTLSLIYVLLPQGYQPQRGKIRLTVGGTTSQLVRFREICLWKQRPAAWWEESPGLMTLSPLCRQQRKPEAAITHAARVIRRREADSVTRANLLTTLGIFGRLCHPKIDVLDVIGREHMKESPFYQQLVAEGRVEARREDVLQALQLRFGDKAVGEFTAGLQRINDAEALSRLHRLAIQSRRLTDFRRQFGEEATAED